MDDTNSLSRYFTIFDKNNTPCFLTLNNNEAYVNCNDVVTLLKYSNNLKKIYTFLVSFNELVIINAIGI